MITRDLFDKILDYPLITYITLLPTISMSRKEINSSILRKNIEMLLTPQDLARRLNQLGINEEIHVDFSNELVILATNLKILDLKYRTVRITAVVEQQKNHLQLLTIRRTYFYSNDLYITVFDLKGQVVPIPTKVYKI